MRINVVLPVDLLREIDRVAGARRRSRFLADAAQEKLARLRFERAAAAAFGAWKDHDHPDLMTSADMRRFRRRIRGPADRRLRRRLVRG